MASLFPDASRVLLVHEKAPGRRFVPSRRRRSARENAPGGPRHAGSVQRRQRGRASHQGRAPRQVNHLAEEELRGEPQAKVAEMQNLSLPVVLITGSSGFLGPGDRPGLKERYRSSASTWSSRSTPPEGMDTDRDRPDLRRERRRRRCDQVRERGGRPHRLGHPSRRLLRHDGRGQPQIRRRSPSKGRAGS